MKFFFSLPAIGSVFRLLEEMQSHIYSSNMFCATKLYRRNCVFLIMHKLTRYFFINAVLKVVIFIGTTNKKYCPERNTLKEVI